MNLVSIWFLIVPALCALGYYIYCIKNNSFFDNKIVAFYLCISVVGIWGTFAIYQYAETSATEILNGQITSKARTQGSYVESYSCNCYTSCSGSGKNRSCSNSCSTCYRDHYTVKWSCDSTIGEFTIDYDDWESSAVYLLPDPQRWTKIKNGIGVSRDHEYTNYVQAVPNSLFLTHFSGTNFKDMIPAYPDQVYDYYYVNRFLPVGVSVPDALEWNAGIQDMLKTRGPTKQVNAIVVVVNTKDEHYLYALQDAWKGAGKNDVVLIIGSTNYPKIDWVGVLSWTKNSLFKIQLRDAVLRLGTVDREKVLSIMGNQIDTNFERRHMKEFEYLKSEISPPFWVSSILAAVLISGIPLMLLISDWLKKRYGIGYNSGYNSFRNRRY